MKGYSKIKENNPFAQRSKSKKEFQFLDTDFESRLNKSSSKCITKNSLEHEQNPNVNDDDGIDKKNEFFLGKFDAHDDHQDHNHQEQHDNRQHVKNGGEKIGAVLRRNFSVSSSTTPFSYQKNNKGGNLERQSSTRAIQEAVKRAFSMRRSTSVNSDRYSRIYDQPMNVQDSDDHYDYSIYDEGSNNGNNYSHQDDDSERNGSMETRSISMKKRNKDNSGKMHVRSKVVRACKRLFSR